MDLRTYYAQKVNDGYNFGGANQTLILLKTASPAALDQDASLDLEEKTGIVDTAEALQIDKRFIWVPDLESAGAGKTEWHCTGTAKAGAELAIKRTGATAGTIYLTRVTFDIEVAKEDGSFVSKATVDATPNFSTGDTAYQAVPVQAFLNLEDYDIQPSERLALRIRAYGYKATTEDGAMKLSIDRGSAKTYLEIFLKEI